MMATEASAASTMTTTTTTSFVQKKLETIRTRPSTILAKEFLSDTDWRTLPERLEKLCRGLERWNCENDDSSESATSWFLDDDPVESKRAAVTAAIQVASTKEQQLLLQQSFESLFAGSLDKNNNDGYHLQQQQKEEDKLFQNLQTLKWIPYPNQRTASTTTFLYRPFVTAIQKVIYRKVKERIAGDYETEHLYEQVDKWNTEHVELWLQRVVLKGGVSTTFPASYYWRTNTNCVLAESFVKIRMEEIFDIITSYPDSYLAVMELRNVLINKTNNQHNKNELGFHLKDSLIRRLNHPGADTSQIIDVYIATIKVLRILDPSDRLLSVVADPVRCYLRNRSDTVRCIITSLVDSEAELYDELRKTDARPLENVTVDSDDEAEPPSLDWEPPPSLFKPRGTLLQGSRHGDILAMLVSIYGSKELFVNEYRLMLADKLLANLDYNTDKERHTLELLKLRFGEMSMNSAEVMLKDITDSVRTNKNIRDALADKKSTAVDAVVLSHIFWPTLQNEQLKHHPRLQAQLDDFANVYAAQKNPRILKWMHPLGTVQLELDIIDEDTDNVETKQFSCSPLLATLISHFEDKPTWTAEELSNETSIPEHIIQKRMAFWVGNRVVVFSSDKNTEYTLASMAQRQGDHHHQNHPHHQHHHMDDEHGGNNTAVSATAQEEEAMEVYESYIVVMLTSLQQAPLDKIHNMLKMMASGSETRYNKTPQQLAAFLQHLCRQERLECGPDGMYKLLRK